jgi:hypothetical protein
MITNNTFEEEQIMTQIIEQQKIEHKQLVNNCAKIQTGDLIFSRGDAILSKLIRYGTKGDVDHVAIVLKIDGMKKDEYVWVAESTASGFVIRAYNYYYIQSSCAIGRVFETLTKEQRDAIRIETIKLINTPYDWNVYLEIIKYIIVHGRGMPTNDATEDANKIICSEALALVYWRALETKLVPSKPFRLTTPQDIYVAKKVNIYKTLGGEWLI